MGHRVGIADLKAHLAEHLRTVKQGHSVLVLERGEPIAQILPYEKDPWSPRVRGARRSPKDLAGVQRFAKLTATERTAVIANLEASEKLEREW